jgi:hypothetical protein
MGHTIKKDYSLYESGRGFDKLRQVSSLIRCVFIPIVQSCYLSLFKFGDFLDFGKCGFF